MSTFLIHAYFLRSRHFTKSRLFSREISTVIESGNVYKITPFNFTLPETSFLMFKFRYSFEDATKVSHVSLRLSTEFGAIKLDDNTYNSDHVEYRGQLAETTLIILDALKYNFLQSKGCHD